MKKQKNTLKLKSVPVNEPVLSREAKTFLSNAIKTKWLSSSGPFVGMFEKRFASYLGVKHAISVSSGTAALHVALLSLNIKSEDEVIVPSFTMAASWLSILYVGAIPVFVDSAPNSYNIDTNLIEEKITKKTKAILAVHIYGSPCNMKKIMSLAKKYNLYVVEDAAEALGGEYLSKKCGSIGDIGCFSFYANKIVATGEGGMIVTNNDLYASKAKGFRDLCHSSNKRFIHDNVGYNYRFTNLQAAIGLGELSNIDNYIKKKISMARIYREGLKDVPGVILPEIDSKMVNVYWMYSIIIDKNYFGMNRDQLRKILLERYEIETRDFFYGPEDQPVLSSIIRGETFPYTKKLSQNGLYLPSGLALTQKQMEYVIKSVREISNSSSKK